jgi:hypothetical protein
MTNQIQGEILFAGWAGNSVSTWAYTPWMPVFGDFGTFAVEVTNIKGVTLSWDVETRTLEDPATTSSILSGTQTIAVIGTSVTQSDSGKPAKELVRYKFSTGSSVSADNFALFRSLDPSWKRNR